MPVPARHILELLCFSFPRRDGPYTWQMANLPEVARFATLRNEDAVISARLHTDKTAEQEDIQRLQAIPVESIALMQSLEERFGDGHYTERKECLEALLTEYERKGITPNTILDILRTADHQRRIELGPGVETDQSRALIAHAQLIQRVRRGLRELSASYRGLIESRSSFQIFEHIDEIERQYRFMERIDQLRTDLGSDPLCGKQFPGPQRRSKRGRPEQAWLKRLRVRLKAAGIPDDPEETFLRCTGYLPYRPIAEP